MQSLSHMKGDRPFHRTETSETFNAGSSKAFILTGKEMSATYSISCIEYFIILHHCCRYIPKATLSAVIICAVIFMVEYETVKPIWKTRQLDQIPLWATFLTCLFWKLEFGILVGVGINLAILLYGIARPKVHVSTVLRKVRYYSVL